jgi:effector-binding domain-containing protein
MTIAALVLSTLVLLLLGAWIAVGVASTSGVATPPYTVLSEHEGYEIREYAPQIVAEVIVEGDFEASLNRGFRKLAGFIFGDNTAPSGTGDSQAIAMTAPVLEELATSSPIAMTAPVLEEVAAGDKRKVTFVMPAEYSMATIPKPRDPDVRLVEIPARRYAASRFSGWVDGKRASRMKARLLEDLTRDKQSPDGAPALAQYDPPWTPPFMLRNEILVPLSAQGASQQ